MEQQISVPAIVVEFMGTNRQPEVHQGCKFGLRPDGYIIIATIEGGPVAVYAPGYYGSVRLVTVQNPPQAEA